MDAFGVVEGFDIIEEHGTSLGPFIGILSRKHSVLSVLPTAPAISRRNAASLVLTTPRTKSAMSPTFFGEPRRRASGLLFG